MASTDTFIEKDSAINDELDRLRLSATHSLVERRDTLVVASVSCIYGLGDPDVYRGMFLTLEKGKSYTRDFLLKKLVSMQYTRAQVDFYRGMFRVRGDKLEIFPAYGDEVLCLDFFGDELEKITEADSLTGKALRSHESFGIYPAKIYVMPENEMERVMRDIRAELVERLAELKSENKLLEAQRLEQLHQLRPGDAEGKPGPARASRTTRGTHGKPRSQDPAQDAVGLPVQGRPGPDRRVARDALPDPGHVRGRPFPQVQPRGIRFPPALGHGQPPPLFRGVRGQGPQRHLRFRHPFRIRAQARSGKAVAEQIIRPTGLIDPEVEIRPSQGQIDNLMAEVRIRAAKQERVLVTTLTKRMAEELTGYFKENGIRVEYLHSDIETMERVKILKSLRLGEFDCLVGINLLREGLDLPEVSLVAILDADKEGFLRSDRSLIQTMGRAARNVEGRVILYADRRTDSMKRAIAETERRRAKQLAYNAAHGITPSSIRSSIKDVLESVFEQDYYTIAAPADKEAGEYLDPEAVPSLIVRIEKEMRGAAAAMEFERAAELRDQVLRLRSLKPGETLSQGELFRFTAKPERITRRGAGRMPRGESPQGGGRWKGRAKR